SAKRRRFSHSCRRSAAIVGADLTNFPGKPSPRRRANALTVQATPKTSGTGLFPCKCSQFSGFVLRRRRRTVTNQSLPQRLPLISGETGVDALHPPAQGSPNKSEVAMISPNESTVLNTAGSRYLPEVSAVSWGAIIAGAVAAAALSLILLILG